MMIPIAKIDTMTIGYIPQLPSLKCFHRPAICSPPRGVCRRVISETFGHACGLLRRAETAEEGAKSRARGTLSEHSREASSDVSRTLRETYARRGRDRTQL